MKKESVVVFSSGICVVFTVVAFILNCLFKIKSNGIFAAEWSAGDALNYIATISGAVSTFILGLIAYKQNEKLQRMEEYNYIANNSSMVLLKKVEIVTKPNIPVDYVIHGEQILDEYDNTDGIKSGYSCELELEKMGDAIPSMVYIEKANFLICDKEKNKLEEIIWVENVRKGFSRLCIQGNNKIAMNLTFLVDSKKHRDFAEKIQINGNCLIAEIIFLLVTDCYVGTRCKCRAYCDYQNSNGKVEWRCNEPQVFFYGHEMVDAKQILILGDKDNGQDENADKK